VTDPAEQALRVRAKAAIRQRMRGLRRVLPESARAARSEALCARLLELPELLCARSVVGYSSLRGEADPVRALMALRERSAAPARLWLPRVGEAGSLRLLAWSGAVDELVESELGIAEPRADAEEIAPADVDVILVPGLAFDERGHRIGYGQGYYDRLLARMPGVFSVGLGYDFQLLGELPDTEGDARLSALVTDARVLRVSQ